MKNAPKTISTAAITLPPMLLALYLILIGGRLPLQDYWAMVAPVYGMDGVSLRFTDWWVPHNGHLIVLPRLIVVLNLFLTGGSNMGLGFIAFGLALGQLYLLVSVLPVQRTLFVLLWVSWFTFIPGGAHLWIWGFAGIENIGANLLAIGAILCLTRFAQTDARRIGWLIGCITLGLLATITYTTALCLWPTLCIGMLLLRLHWRWTILMVVVTGAVILAFLWVNHAYLARTVGEMAAQEKTTGTAHVMGLRYLSVFLLTYFGAIFSTTAPYPAISGLLAVFTALSLGGYVAFYAGAATRSHLAPWLLLLPYVLGIGLITTVGRASGGLHQALNPWYGNGPALFVLSLLIIGVYLFENWFSAHRELSAVVQTGLTLVIITTMLTVIWSRLHLVTDGIPNQPLAVASVNLGVPDYDVIASSITQAPEQFVAMVPLFKARRLIPFDRPDHRCGRWGELFEPAEVVAPSVSILPGFFDALHSFSEEGARVEGWAYHGRNNAIECIVLVDSRQIVRGFGLPGFARPDVGRAPEVGEQNTGWKGYVRIQSTPEDLTAYVRFKGARHWFILHNSQSFV